MDRRLEERLQSAPGFGSCQRCPFVESGPAELCYACARRTLESLADRDHRCEVCDRPYESGETTCRNWLCGYSGRYFQWNFAIAMRSGALETALNRYKYSGARGWGLIFGRILAGFLEQQSHTFEAFDLIVASPTYVASDGRDFDHTGLVLQRAAEELAPGRLWPFDSHDNPAIVKTGPTESLMGKSYARRREIGETELRAALKVPDPDRTRAKRILVYDDVFTDGRTLDEVARALRGAGEARAVCGVTLCRQPWRGG